jgi:SnoaL-like domain
MNVEHLADIEAIKQLKARYFRLMDAKNWAELGDVFTRDAVAGGGGTEITSRAAIIEFISTTASDRVRTAHQGFLPEIEIVGPGRARGVWAMSDYFEVRGTEPPVGFQGFGHYEDRYAREEGTWRISATRLTRIKVIPLAGGLPAFYSARPGSARAAGASGRAPAGNP